MVLIPGWFVDGPEGWTGRLTSIGRSGALSKLQTAWRRELGPHCSGHKTRRCRELGHWLGGESGLEVVGHRPGLPSSAILNLNQRGRK